MYVGQTINNPEERWRKHSSSRSNCVYLKRALDSYGIDNFKFRVVCICFDASLDQYEKEYIKKYNTLVPNGYNIREGGNNARQHKSTKAKISATLLTKNAGKRSSQYGKVKKPLTAEHKQKIKDALTGVPTQRLRRILQKDSNENVIKRHDGVCAAARDVGCHRETISKALKNKTTLNGYMFQYDETTAVS